MRENKTLMFGIMGREMRRPAQGGKSSKENYMDSAAGP